MLNSEKGPFHSQLEELYRKFNRREYIRPDPLEFVLRFDEPGDQEIAGMIASSLAYGRVGNILNSLEKVFHILRSPSADLAAAGRKELLRAFAPFRHRWTTGEELGGLLSGIARLRRDYGSLENCFLEGSGENDRDVIPALTRFVARLRQASQFQGSSLLPCPSMGSACKRLFLYLRWMVRRDEVDPGPWKQTAPARLVVPMDVHMHRVCRQLGLTGRRQADLKSALEVTAFFRGIEPDDPVKYDFTMTRPGIHPGLDPGIVFDPLKAGSRCLC